MSQFSENLRTDGRTEKRKDGQTLFYRILPAKTWGPKKLRLAQACVILWVK